MQNETNKQLNTEVISMGSYDEAPTDFEVVLYHGECSDGFSAAWVARKFMLDSRNVEPLCIPINHDGVYNFPKEVDGKIVLVVDLTFPVEKMFELKARAKSVFVIDHHLFAPERCQESGIPFVYDKEQCGASLTWRVYFREAELPLFLKYIKAGDLWRWGKLVEDHAIVTALHSYENDFDNWDMFFEDSFESNKSFKRLYNEAENQYFVNKYQEQGESLERKAKRSISQLMKRAKVVTFYDYQVPVVNATEHISALGNELAKAYPQCPFAVVYFDDTVTNMRHWSLRSIGDNDVSVVAKRFGGGGHKNAAGFSSENPYGHIPVLLGKAIVSE